MSTQDLPLGPNAVRLLAHTRLVAPQPHLDFGGPNLVTQVIVSAFITEAAATHLLEVQP